MLSDSFQHVSFHCSLIWGCAKRYHSYMCSVSTPNPMPGRFPSNLSKSQLVLLTLPYFLVPYIHNHSTLVSADPAYPRAVFSRTVLRGTIMLYFPMPRTHFWLTSPFLCILPSTRSASLPLVVRRRLSFFLSELQFIHVILVPLACCVVWCWM